MGEQGPDARVISEAVAPSVPSFPKPRLILTLALTGGLLVGLAAMYVAETGERGLRSARDVARGAGPADPGAGAAAGARPARGIAPQDYVLERPRSRYAEALREVLTGLLLRRAADAAAGPGAGWCWSPRPCPARASRPSP